MKAHIMKKLAIISLVGLGALGVAGIASAYGGFGGFMSQATPEEIAQHQQQMFEHQAEMLGLSTDEVKDAWAEGKTFQELAEVNGISEDELKAKMQETRKVRMRERMQALVDQGVITQDQADARLRTMPERMECGEFPDRKRGFHRGLGN